MKTLLLALSLGAAATSVARADSYYCTTSTDGWRYDRFDINPADLDQTLAYVDPLARWLYVSCLGRYDGDVRLLDCAILDDNPDNVLASGTIPDGGETLTVTANYDGRSQSVTCQRRHPRP